MESNEAKERLCELHHGLLTVLIRYGNGAMLTAQLQRLCMALGLYPSKQAVNRAVRSLKRADILTRMTWVDNNRDLLIARKYVYRHFTGKPSRGVATPKRYTTARQYLLQCCKVDRLILWVEGLHLDSIEAVEAYLERAGCTLFLHLPELSGYFQRNRGLFGAYNPAEYRAQLDKLAEGDRHRECLAQHIPYEPDPARNSPLVVTLEKMHRRGVFILGMTQKKMKVGVFQYSGSLTAPRVMDFALDAWEWVRSLMPFGYEVHFVVFTLDKAGRDKLTRQLKAPQSNGVSYCESRAQARRINEGLHLTVKDGDIIRQWCGNVRPII